MMSLKALTLDGHTVNVTQPFNTRRYHSQCYSAL